MKTTESRNKREGKFLGKIANYDASYYGGRTGYSRGHVPKPIQAFTGGIPVGWIIEASKTVTARRRLASSFRANNSAISLISLKPIYTAQRDATPSGHAHQASRQEPS